MAGSVLFRTRAVMGVLLLGLLGALWWTLKASPETGSSEPSIVEWRAFFQDYVRPALKQADAFDWPLLPPEGEGSFITQGYREKESLGETWEVEPSRKEAAIPVHAVADGWVSLADDFASRWGFVVMTIHRVSDDGYPDSVEVMYANLGKPAVKQGGFVARGQVIGWLTPEAPGGQALYFEIREEVGLGLGPSESGDDLGWTQPSAFLRQHHEKGPAK
jgi:murein DD-endopeptidase MepM/ murein hydrolase activator NlpD